MTLWKSYTKKQGIVIKAKVMDEDFEVETMEGKMHGKKGDYLAVGVRGEEYIVKKNIFEEIYEEVNEE